VGKLPNKISVEGHTDATPYAKGANYTNWELSSDRANAARRLVQRNGIREDQVTQVRGFADQMLLKPNAPFDPSNRRISLIIQNLEPGQAGDLSSLGSSVKVSPSTAQPSPPAAAKAPEPPKP